MLCTSVLCATVFVVMATMTVGQDSPSEVVVAAPPSAETSSAVPSSDASRKWLDDWNDYWLNYDPTSPNSAGPTDTVPGSAVPPSAVQGNQGNSISDVLGNTASATREPMSVNGVVRIVGSDGSVESKLSELATELAAQGAADAPGTIHRKIWANPLDDPSNQKAIFFCVVCTILIVTGVRLILRKRAMNRIARSARAPATSDAVDNGVRDVSRKKRFRR